MRTGNRIRFSRLPPYSSVRWLNRGVMKHHSSAVSKDHSSSTPSNPLRIAMSTLFTLESINIAMSSSSTSLAISPCGPVGNADGPYTGQVNGRSRGTPGPKCPICVLIFVPYS
jgi:hypothetical protein